ncbi:MAG TPA: hypothetical protein VEK06_02320, partial [Myxococcota bacterium]|nr:hypothetical protein [Myxococcota bacterium]
MQRSPKQDSQKELSDLKDEVKIKIDDSDDEEDGDEEAALQQALALSLQGPGEVESEIKGVAQPSLKEPGNDDYVKGMEFFNRALYARALPELLRASKKGHPYAPFLVASMYKLG